MICCRPAKSHLGCEGEYILVITNINISCQILYQNVEGQNVEVQNVEVTKSRRDKTSKDKMSKANKNK